MLAKIYSVKTIAMVMVYVTSTMLNASAKKDLGEISARKEHAPKTAMLMDNV